MSHPSFHLYQCRNLREGYEYIGSMMNTGALFERLNSDTSGCLVILSESRPGSDLIERIPCTTRDTFLCPATDELVRQIGHPTYLHFDAIEFITCDMTIPGPDRLFRWLDLRHYDKTSIALADQDLTSIAVCPDAYQAFNANVLNDGDYHRALSSLAIHNWVDFQNKYHHLETDIAVTIAKRVSVSVSKSIDVSINNKTTMSVLAQCVIDVAFAAPPWLSHSLPIINVRAHNALKTGRISSLKDLSLCTPNQIIKLPNFGRRSLIYLIHDLIYMKVNSNDLLRSKLAV